MSERKRFKGVIPKDGRITLPKEVRETLHLEDDTFYFLEIYGNDKLLITLIK